MQFRPDCVPRVNHDRTAREGKVTDLELLVTQELVQGRHLASTHPTSISHALGCLSSPPQVIPNLLEKPEDGGALLKRLLEVHPPSHVQRPPSPPNESHGPVLIDLGDHPHAIQQRLPKKRSLGMKHADMFPVVRRLAMNGGGHHSTVRQAP
jgi:hypothetical protein